MSNDTKKRQETYEPATGEYGGVTAPGAVRFERLLPGPIERVWAHLTESEKRGKWLATGETELRVGGRVELHFRHRDLSPQIEETPEKFKQYEDGAHFTGTVTACEPPRLLGLTWEDASEVTFELGSHGDEVLLVLTHRRLADRASMVEVASGWHTHLAILADELRGAERRPFWSTYAPVEAEYETRIPPDVKGAR